MNRYGQTVAAGQDGDIMFVPQRPYMVLGSLREQVLYPTWATSSPITPKDDADDAQSAASRQVVDSFGQDCIAALTRRQHPSSSAAKHSLVQHQPA